MFTVQLSFLLFDYKGNLARIRSRFLLVRSFSRAEDPILAGRGKAIFITLLLSSLSEVYECAVMVQRVKTYSTVHSWSSSLWVRPSFWNSDA